jgi:hypothetical protein
MSGGTEVSPVVGISLAVGLYNVPRATHQVGLLRGAGLSTAPVLAVKTGLPEAAGGTDTQV